MRGDRVDAFDFWVLGGAGAHDVRPASVCGVGHGHFAELRVAELRVVLAIIPGGDNNDLALRTAFRNFFAPWAMTDEWVLKLRVLPQAYVGSRCPLSPDPVESPPSVPQSPSVDLPIGITGNSERQSDAHDGRRGRDGVEDACDVRTVVGNTLVRAGLVDRLACHVNHKAIDCSVRKSGVSGLNVRVDDGPLDTGAVSWVGVQSIVASAG